MLLVLVLQFVNSFESGSDSNSHRQQKQQKQQQRQQRQQQQHHEGQKSKHYVNHHQKPSRVKNFIEVLPSECFDETCYHNLTDVWNSPLVECSLLPATFYQCDSLFSRNSTNNCTKLGVTKYQDVQITHVKCSVFDYIECRGNRHFYRSVPCIKYTDKYFVSTIIYSVFLGIFAVDRCCIGHTGIGIGKLITLGGLGVWYIIDIILLVLGMIKPSDNSNWIPYF